MDKRCRTSRRTAARRLVFASIWCDAAAPTLLKGYTSQGGKNTKKASRVHGMFFLRIQNATHDVSVPWVMVCGIVGFTRTYHLPTYDVE
jgi:hypothetical protein